jgi:hypothetical protein
MARARNIKPSFFRNEYLLNLSYAARLLFIGLWTVADREGRLEDRPRKIKLDLFPDDDIDLDALLSELHHSEGNFIKRYEVNGKRCIQIINFSKHQKPHKKETESELPEMPVLGPTQPEKNPASNDLFPASRAESLLPITESLTPKRLCDEKYGEISKQGFEYLQSFNLANLNLSGLEKKLAFEFDKLHQAHLHLKPEHLLECWMASCDVLRGKPNVSSLNYIFSTFSSKLAAFQPTQSVRPQAQIAKKEVWQVISGSKSIVNIFNPEDIRDGTEYSYKCFTGLDARLKHKTTGEEIRCGDYKVNST